MKGKGVNVLLASGIVVSEIDLKKTKRNNWLCAKTRIKLSNDYLLDLYGYGDIAQQMNLICKLGYYIYAEAHLVNKRYVNKKGKAKAKFYFLVDYIEMVGIPKEAQINNLDSIIEIIDDIDPIKYL